MNFIPFYMFVLYCIFKKVFLQKNYLKAFSKVHVNFNELQIKFKCYPQKMVLTDFYKKLCSIDGKVKFNKMEG